MKIYFIIRISPSGEIVVLAEEAGQYLYVKEEAREHLADLRQMSPGDGYIYRLACLIKEQKAEAANGAAAKE